AQQLDGLNLLKDALASEKPSRTVEFRLRLRFDDLRLCGDLVLEAMFRGNARLISQCVESRAVFAYGVPGENAAQRQATLEGFSLGETSIVHDADRISVLLDISQLKMPPFCQFRFFELAAEKELEHDSIEFYGLDKLWVAG